MKDKGKERKCIFIYEGYLCNFNIGVVADYWKPDPHHVIDFN